MFYKLKITSKKSMVMDSDYNNDSEPKLSVFNSGIAQLYRIGALWDSSHRLILENNFVKFNFVLDRVWQELVPRCSAEEKEVFNKINDKIKKIFAINSTKQHIYDALMLKENFIRVIQNEQGKGDAIQDELEDYFH